MSNKPTYTKLKAIALSALRNPQKDGLSKIIAAHSNVDYHMTSAIVSVQKAACSGISDARFSNDINDAIYHLLLARYHHEQTRSKDPNSDNKDA